MLSPPFSDTAMNAPNFWTMKELEGPALSWLWMLQLLQRPSGGKKTPVGPGRSHGEMAGFSNWSTGACSQVLYPQRSPLTGLFLFIWVARSATPISKKLQPCSEHWPFMDVGKKCPLFPPATEDSGPAPCSDRRTPGHDCPSATEYPLQALRWQPSPDQWVGSTKIQYPAPPKKIAGHLQ